MSAHSDSAQGTALRVACADRCLPDAIQELRGLVSGPEIEQGIASSDRFIFAVVAGGATTITTFNLPEDVGALYVGLLQQYRGKSVSSFAHTMALDKKTLAFVRTAIHKHLLIAAPAEGRA